ncbi:MAG TPA: carbohydrate-binding family 9-like protein [Bacteroidales bacterium]|nr:carbohydrate-binding family 9-like protein [Bacteroidales bacterium]
MDKKFSQLLTRSLLFGLFILIFSSCRHSVPVISTAADRFPPEPKPESYVAYRTSTPIVPDGVLDEEAWIKAPWTTYFRDIEGPKKPDPWFKTRAKVLWDDTNIYFAAELEEPHVWANLRQRDTIIFIDNDFEIFIDPDGDTHAYYELEVNAFGTPWDLLLLKPYRDGGPAVFGWDIAGLKVGVHIEGTINNPADEDKGWTVEIVIPLIVMSECSIGRQLPKPGDHWRLGFSRVEWRTHIENSTYVKDINPDTGRPFPEENWVWSPQGRINMHMPEMWGYLQFSSLTAGAGEEAFVPDNDRDLKWALRLIYYAENEYYAKNKKYSSSLSEIGLSMKDFSEGLSEPAILATRTTFESYFPNDPTGKGWTIYNDGRLLRIADSLVVK